MRPSIVALTVLGGLAQLETAFCAVHEVWWDLTYVQGVDPDRAFPRRAIGVNGTWPYVSFHLSDLAEH